KGELKRRAVHGVDVESSEPRISEERQRSGERHKARVGRRSSVVAEAARGDRDDEGYSRKKPLHRLMVGPGAGDLALYASGPMSGGIAIVGAGYVGVPLAQVFAEAGHSVLLVDVDAERVERLNRGESYIEDVSSEPLGPLRRDH